MDGVLGEDRGVGWERLWRLQVKTEFKSKGLFGSSYSLVFVGFFIRVYVFTYYNNIKITIPPLNVKLYVFVKIKKRYRPQLKHFHE